MKLLISLSKAAAPHKVDPQIAAIQQQIKTYETQLKQVRVRLKGRMKINISGKQMDRAKILELETRIEEAREKLTAAREHAAKAKPSTA